MRVAREKRELRERVAAARREGRSIGLVPTMGFLHDGHVSLLRAARERTDFVVMSLFVNPTQFGPEEDLDAYPRDEDRDLEVAEREGVDLVYAPPTAEVYAAGHATSVVVDGTSEVLCGERSRRGAGHFRGVATVVAKLLNSAQPDVAFFGQKDAQQAIVIKRMVADLDFPVRIDVLPTVREPDGLAISSRNANLLAEERRRAPAIHRALAMVSDGAAPGAPLRPLLERADAQLRAAGIEPEYIEARDAESLEPIDAFNGRPVLVAVAAPFEGARLIDNVVIEPTRAGPEGAGADRTSAGSPASNGGGST